MSPLSEWQNYYVIIGSSAGALIGLQFVLITLIANVPTTGSAQAGQAYATPTIVHFGVVLTLAGAGCAPWKSALAIAGCWGSIGVFGLIYMAIVMLRMRRQSSYQPEFEDWLFHVLLPLASYIAISCCALSARSEFTYAAFGIAGAALLLMFVGIHNAWDAATYHVFVVQRRLAKKKEGTPPADAPAR